MLKEIPVPNQFFLRDPELCLQGLHDSDLKSLKETKQLQDRPDSKWFEVDNKIAVVRMEPNDRSVIVHVYIATQFQKQNLLKFIVVDIINYLMENTNYLKIIVPIPKTCQHVIRTMKPLGFKKEGTFKGAISWRNEQVDLIYYTRQIW